MHTLPAYISYLLRFYIYILHAKIHSCRLRSLCMSVSANAYIPVSGVPYSTSSSSSLSLDVLTVCVHACCQTLANYLLNKALNLK
jgi:hypothetical protein